MQAILDQTDIDAVRRFNRLYTQRLGLLKPRLDDSAFALTEARVLYELAHRTRPTSAEIAKALALDRGQLSRILARFVEQGLVEATISPLHAKRRLLALTAAGRRAFKKLEQGTNEHIATLLTRFDGPGRTQLLDHVTQIAKVLDPEPGQQAPIRLRPLRVGDAGWVIHRQSVLYAEEHGWDASYEALAAEILADFLRRFDPARDDAWIAERDGAVMGSVFLVRSGRAKVAKLRLLYVEPAARGAGVGQMLVEACIARARALGYRTLELWTNDVLVSARRLYERAGFALVDAKPHHSFGKDLVGQTHRLRL